MDAVDALRGSWSIGQGIANGDREKVVEKAYARHDRKSAANKKKRFAHRAAKKRQAEEEAAATIWQAWEALPDDVKRLLGPTGAPKMQRPVDA